MADFGELARRQVDSLLLNLRAGLLVVRALLELTLEFVDVLGQLRELFGDDRDVVFSSHAGDENTWPLRRQMGVGMDIPALPQILARARNPPLRECARAQERVPLWKKEVYEGGEEWIGRGS